MFIGYINSHLSNYSIEYSQFLLSFGRNPIFFSIASLNNPLAYALVLVLSAHRHMCLCLYVWFWAYVNPKQHNDDDNKTM